MLKRFFFPKMTKAYLVRILAVMILAVLIFKFVLIPIRIQGKSMAPTYGDGTFNFCFKWRYLFENPKRFDVVGIRMAGERVILLKRVVATEGETVEIRNGVLFVNGRRIDEPYLINPLDWNLLPRVVKPGHVYVIGDNRRVPMHIHQFGQTQISRIAGAPLW